MFQFIYLFKFIVLSKSDCNLGLTPEAKLNNHKSQHYVPEITCCIYLLINWSMSLYHYQIHVNNITRSK